MADDGKPFGKASVKLGNVIYGPLRAGETVTLPLSKGEAAIYRKTHVALCLEPAPTPEYGAWRLVSTLPLPDTKIGNSAWSPSCTASEYRRYMAFKDQLWAASTGEQAAEILDSFVRTDVSGGAVLKTVIANSTLDRPLSQAGVNEVIVGALGRKQLSWKDADYLLALVNGDRVYGHSWTPEHRGWRPDRCLLAQQHIEILGMESRPGPQCYSLIWLHNQFPGVRVDYPMSPGIEVFYDLPNPPPRCVPAGSGKAAQAFWRRVVDCPDATGGSGLPRPGQRQEAGRAGVPPDRTR